MAEDTPDFVALAERVGEQRDIAKDILDEIKRLDAVIAAERDPENKQALQAIRDRLLNQMTRFVASNNATISIVSSTMGFIREWTKR